MGMHQVKKCIISDLPAHPIIDGFDEIDYKLKINGKDKIISLPWEALNWNTDEDFFVQNKRLLNDNWFEKNELITIEKLKSLIAEKDYPRTPKQKLEMLFIKLSQIPKEDGDRFFFTEEMKENLVVQVYFKSIQELLFYTESLINENLIKTSLDSSMLQITFKGLERRIQLEEDGQESNKCFIAMSFKESTKGIRTAIKNALNKTGFDPIIIDERHIDSDKTINDEIISNLKQCNFCISDFTYHSNGVYFESGFALGQGKKVIYTCKEDEFQNAHFDIRPLQHIIYKTEQELEKDLINKIEAWIKK